MSILAELKVLPSHLAEGPQASVAVWNKPTRVFFGDLLVRFWQSEQGPPSVSVPGACCTRPANRRQRTAATFARHMYCSAARVKAAAGPGAQLCQGRDNAMHGTRQDRTFEPCCATSGKRRLRVAIGIGGLRWEDWWVEVLNTLLQPPIARLFSEPWIYDRFSRGALWPRAPCAPWVWAASMFVGPRCSSLLQR